MAEYDPPFTATNNSNARLVYRDRQYYQWRTEEIFNSENPNYVDLWYAYPFYGKVDNMGRLVVPNESLLSMTVGDQQFYAPPPIYNAVLDFQTKARSLISYGKTDLAQLIGGASVLKSYESPYSAYLEHALQIIQGYNEVLVDPDERPLGHPVVNFTQYVEGFVRYVADWGKDVPFTFCRYYASPEVTIHATAMGFDLQNYDCSDDRIKNSFFKHSEFNKYVQLAANFGLRININAPWMLIADLRSEPMAKYLYNDNKGKLSAFFDTYYSRAIDWDVYYLILFMQQGYSWYQSTKEFVVTSHPCTTPEPTFRAAILSNVRSREKLWHIEKADKELYSFLQSYGGTIAFVTLLERIKYAEVHGSLDIKRYRAFKQKFDTFINKKEEANALSHLDHFYNPARIYRNRQEGTPAWNTYSQPNAPNNSLISQGKISPAVIKKGLTKY